MGNGRRLKEELGDQVKIVAAEPMQGEPVQGLRSLDEGFIPPIIDLSLLDRKIFVTNTDAIVFTRKLLDEEGLFTGRLVGRDRAGGRPDRVANSTRATSCSSSPTTAGSTCRRGSTRVPSRRSRTWTPPSGGERPPDAGRPDRARAPDRRRGVAGGALLVAGCGTTSLRSSVKKGAKVAPADVDVLNRLLGARALRGRGVHGRDPVPAATRERTAAKQFLGQELAHASTLAGLIKQAGGKAVEPRARYALGHPARRRDILALLHRLEAAQLAAYLELIPALTRSRCAPTAAAIMANDAQHLAVLRQELGQAPVPSPFATGRE